MIIYIHGFGGSGEGSKAKAFRKYFNSIGETFIAPSLSYVPELAIKTLEELIESYHGDVCLIGSSLGGYYTMYLAQKYNLKAVLINPSINPVQTLQRSLGSAPNFYDGSYYNWNDTHLAMLQTYKTEVAYQKNFKLLLQTGDELLDYNEALNYLPNAYKTVEKGGSHSFEGIESHFESIRAFFAIGDYFKHTLKVKGIGFELDELANRVGDLYYDSLSSFLTYLAWKLDKDAKADRERGRKKLALFLEETAQQIKKSSETMQDAFYVVEPHIYKWEIDHGSNRNGLHFESKILDTPDRAQCQIWVSDIHITNLVIIDEIKDDGSISRPISDSYWEILDFEGKEVDYLRNDFVDDTLFALFDEEDKQRLDKFIPMLNEHINSLEINQKFTYIKGYNEEDDVEINFMDFREIYTQNGWKETILGSTGERYWTHVILRISKDNKLFQYTTYASMRGGFVVAKYNDDCKDFVENVLFKALLGDKSHEQSR
jgi:predicted esterase YcpF (UPF0227 family)